MAKVPHSAKWLEIKAALESAFSMSEPKDAIQKFRENFGSLNTTDMDEMVQFIFTSLKTITITLDSESPNYLARLMLVETLIRLHFATYLKENTKQLLDLYFYLMENDAEQIALLVLPKIFEIIKASTDNIESLYSYLELFLKIFISHYKNFNETVNYIFNFQYFTEKSREILDLYNHANEISAKVKQYTVQLDTLKNNPQLVANPSNSHLYDNDTVAGSANDQKLKDPVVIQGRIQELQKEQRKSAESLRKAIEEVKDTRCIVGSKSFRVTQELPLLVLIVEQKYLVRPLINQMFEEALKDMVGALNVQVSELARYCFRKKFADYVECNTSSLSFLSCLIPKHPDFLLSYGKTIIENLVHLLKIALPDAHGVRRHLIVALRHIITNEKYRGFYRPHLDILLDENTLLGNSKSVLTQNRSVAYSYLSEIVHYFRLCFNINQIKKIITIFSCNLHDSSLPIITQTNAAKLLMNMIEPICKISDIDINEKNKYIAQLLATIVEKFKTLVDYLPKVVEAEKYRNEHPSTRSPIPPPMPIASNGSELPENLPKPPEPEYKYSNTEIFELKHSVIPSGYGIYISQTEIVDYVRDIRSLVRVLFMGLKTLLWCLSSKSSSQRNDNNNNNIQEFDENILRLVSSFTRCSFILLPILFNTKDISPIEKDDLIRHFTEIYTVMNPIHVNEIFSELMPIIFEAIMKENYLISFCKKLAWNDKLTKEFCTLFIKYFMENISCLGDSEKGKILNKIFQLCVLTPLPYYTNNIIIIHEYLIEFLYECINSSTIYNDNYYFMFQILSLFKNMSRQGFDTNQKDLSYITGAIIISLLRMQHNCSSADINFMLLELLLTSPNRLPHMINQIPLLFEPLVLSLKSDYDSIIIGLKTIDLWIDSYTSEFMTPLLRKEPIATTLMTALSDILHKYDQPKIITFIMKLYGKLGGKSKQYLEQVPILSYKKEYTNTFILATRYDNNNNNNKALLLPLDYSIEKCYKTVEKYIVPIHKVKHHVYDGTIVDTIFQNNYTIYSFKYQTLQFIELILSKLLSSEQTDINTDIILQKKIKYKSIPILNTTPLNDVDSNICRLYNLLLLLSSDKDMNILTMNVIKNWIRHLFLVYLTYLTDTTNNINSYFHFVNKYLFYSIKEEKPKANAITSLYNKSDSFAKSQLLQPYYVYSPYNSETNVENLSVLVFNDSLVDNLTMDNQDTVDSIISIIEYMNELMNILCPNKPMLYFLHYYEDLTSKLLSIYTTDWRKLWAITLVIKKLIEILPVNYSLRYCPFLFRYLFDILSSVPSEANPFIKQPLFDTINLLFNKIKSTNLTNLEDEFKENNNTQQQLPPPLQQQQPATNEKSYFLDNKILLDDIIQLCIIQLLKEIEPSREIAQKIIYDIYSEGIVNWEVHVSFYCEKFTTLYAQMRLNWSQASIYLKVALLNSINFMYKYFFNSFKTRFLKDVTIVLDESISDTMSYIPDMTVSQAEIIKNSISLVSSQVSVSTLRAPFDSLIIVEHRIQVLLLAEQVILYNKSKLPDFLKLCIPSLSSSNKQIIIITKRLLESIKNILKENNPPLSKTLLSDTITPLLSKLVEPTITVPLLKALQHLLDLFSESFNPGIGERLLQHLDRFAATITASISPSPTQQPGTNQTPNQQQQQPQIQKEMTIGGGNGKEDPVIVASLIDLFHLIPVNPAASIKYVDKLFLTVSQLEKNNRNNYYRYLNSPYRIPLVHIMNKYAAEAVNLFLNEQKLTLNQSAPLFFSILDHPEAVSLRNEFQNPANSKKIIEMMQNFYYKKMHAYNETYYNLLHIIYVLASHTPTWLKTEIAIVQELIRLWQDPKLLSFRSFYPNPPFPKLVLDTFLLFAQTDSPELIVTWLFEICRCFTQRSSIDYTYVIEFFKNVVSKKYTIEKRIHILTYFFTKLLPNENLDILKTVSLKYMVNPMVAYTLSDPTEQSETLQTSVKDCLPIILKNKILSTFSDSLKVEILKFCTILLENIPQKIAAEQKALIKYAWDHLKSDDTETKHYAFVTVCRFFEVYFTPSKIINQVYVAMLKSSQTECRDVLWKGFTILMPLLPLRFKKEEKIQCLDITCKILRDEANNETPKLNIFRLLNTYPDFYFDCRKPMIERIIASIPVFLKGLPFDTKKLYVDMTKLILSYIEKSIKIERKRDVNTLPPPTTTTLTTETATATTTTTTASSETKMEEEDNEETKEGDKEKEDEKDIIYVDETTVEYFTKNETEKENNRENGFIKTYCNKIIYQILSTSYSDRYYERDQMLHEESLKVLEKIVKIFPIVNIEFINIAVQEQQLILNCFQTIPINNLAVAKEEETKKSIALRLAYFKVISILIANTENNFFTKHYQDIMKFYTLLLNTIKLQNYAPILHNFHQILFKLLAIHPTEVEGFINILTEYITNLITQTNEPKIIPFPTNPSGHSQQPSSYDKDVKINRFSTFPALLILKHIFLYCPSYVDRFVDMLIHLTKVEIEKFIYSQNGPIIQHKSTKIKYPYDDFIDRSTEIYEDYKCEVLTSFHIIIELVGKRLLYLPSVFRKNYLELIQNTLKQNKLSYIVTTILDIIYDWIYPNNEPTVEREILYNYCKNDKRQLYCDELIELIKSMKVITKLASRLDMLPTSAKYLNLIYYYCTEQKDVPDNIMKQVIIPLTYSYADIRIKFLELYNKYCSKDPYERLMSILNLHDSDTLAQRNWIIFTDIVLLDFLPKDSQILFPPALRFGAVFNSTNDQNLNTVVRDDDNKEKIVKLLKDENSFINNSKRFSSTDLINIYDTLISMDPFIADNIYSVLFTQIWNYLSVEQKNTIPKSVKLFLSKNLHYKSNSGKISLFYNCENNTFHVPKLLNKYSYNLHSSIYSPVITTISHVPSCLQTFIQTISNIDPLPLLDPDILYYLATTLNCTYYVIKLLELYIALPNEMNEEYIRILYRLYEYIHDNDLQIGLYHYNVNNRLLKNALFCELHNLYNKSHDIYMNLINNIVNNNNNNNGNDTVSLSDNSFTQNNNNDSNTGKFNELETEIILHRYENCCKKLRRWDILLDTAKYQNNLALALECEFKLEEYNQFIKDFQQIEDASNSYQSVFEMYDIKIVLYFLCASTYEKPKNLPSNLLYKCVEYFSKKWISYSPILNQSHSFLLSQFQLISELFESHQFLTTFNILQNQSNNNNNNNITPNQPLMNDEQEKRNKQAQQLKHYIRNIWKTRLPDIADPIEIWDDLLIWRKKFIDLLNIINHPYINEMNYVSTVDTSWTVVKRITVARKHNLDIFAQSYIDTLTSVKQMDMHDLYSKLRDQLLIYYKYPSKLTNGLEIISNTFLVYFIKEHKAAMCRLKGNFLNKCRERPLLNPLIQPISPTAYTKESIIKAYSSSVSYNAEYYKTWINWAELYEKCYLESGENHDAYEAIVCYLHAVICNSTKTLLYVSRILFLLTKNGDNGLRKQVMKYINFIPQWIWIRHVNQLLSMLSYCNSDIVLEILQNVVKTTPQCIIPSLRIYHYIYNMSRQYYNNNNSTSQITSPVNQPIINNNNNSIMSPSNVNNNNTSGMMMIPGLNNMMINSPNQQSNNNNRGPHPKVDILIKIVKDNHSLLYTEIGSLYEEMNYTLIEDDLIRTLNDLMGRIISMNINAQTQLSRETIEHFEQIYINYFENNNTYPQYVELKETYYMEMKPTTTICTNNKLTSQLNPKFPKTYAELLNRINIWILRLTSLVMTHNNNIPLIRRSYYLSNYRNTTIEMPNRYMAITKPLSQFIEIPTKINTFNPFLPLVIRNNVPHRLITVVGDNGSTLSFIFPRANTSTVGYSRLEERMSEMNVILNECVKKNVDVKKRLINFRPLVIIPITQYNRLVEDKISNISLEEIYNTNCFYKNIDPLTPVSIFINNNNNTDRSVLYEQTTKIVGNTVLSNFFMETSQSSENYWILKRNFSQSLAIHSFFTYIFYIDSRNPKQFLINRENGEVSSSLDFTPSYNDNFELKSHTKQKFRLTPNIVSMLGGSYINGSFAGAISAIGSCLSEVIFPFEGYLQLFERDNIIVNNYMKICQNRQRQSVQPKMILDDDELKQLEVELKEKVKGNVDKIIHRISKLNTTNTNRSEFVNDYIYVLVEKNISTIRNSNMPLNWSSWL